MAERTTTSQLTQIGVETSPGAGGSAGKLLQVLSIEPSIKTDIKRFAPKGAKYTTIAALGKEWVEAKISAEVACYNHLAYLLAGAMAYAAPTKQGSTSAYLWTFKPALSAEDTIKTFVVEQGSSVRAGGFSYGIVRGLTMRFNRNEITIDGTMLGQAYEDDIEMTATPTAIPMMPILPGELDVYLDDTAANIGNTKLTRAFAGEFSLGDRFGPIWPLNSEIDGFAAHVERKPSAQFKLLVEADAAGMGPLTAMRAGSKQYVRLAATGPNIADTYNYSFQLDMALIVADVSEFRDEEGVYAIEWTFDIAWDSAWESGTGMKVTLVNTLTGL